VATSSFQRPVVSSCASPLSRKASDPLLAWGQSEDGTVKEDDPIDKFGRLLSEAMIVTGRTPPSEELLRERVEKAGFVDVQSFTFRLPVGPWAKDRYEPWNSTRHKREIIHADSGA
jgi:hypothetical protein